MCCELYTSVPNFRLSGETHTYTHTTKLHQNVKQTSCSRHNCIQNNGIKGAEEKIGLITKPCSRNSNCLCCFFYLGRHGIISKMAQGFINLSRCLRFPPWQPPWRATWRRKTCSIAVGRCDTLGLAGTAHSKCLMNIH